VTAAADETAWAWQAREPDSGPGSDVAEAGAGGYDDLGDPEDLPAMVFRPGWPR
jgi:hypothetical protein